jgi:hypothetical protein
VDFGQEDADGEQFNHRSTTSFLINCTVANCQGPALMVYADTTKHLVLYNNIFVALPINGSNPYTLLFYDATHVYPPRSYEGDNNIFFNSIDAQFIVDNAFPDTPHEIGIGDSPEHLSDWQGATHQDAHSQFISSAESLFVNLQLNDFHLRALSPAINAGTAIPAFIPKNDLDGRNRDAQPDIGCYEYQGVSGVRDVGYQATEDLVIFPNPAHSTVTLSLPASDECTIQLTGMRGDILRTINRVKSELNDDTITVPITDLAKGAYFLRIYGNDWSTSKVLIVR